jgi:hypothetical protein
MDNRPIMEVTKELGAEFHGPPHNSRSAVPGTLEYSRRT